MKASNAFNIENIFSYMYHKKKFVLEIWVEQVGQSIHYQTFLSIIIVLYICFLKRVVNMVIVLDCKWVARAIAKTFMRVKCREKC